MAVATREREIDGHRYSVSQLPAMRALRLLNRLGRIAGPSLAALAESGEGDLVEAARGLFDRLPDDEVESVTKELLAGVLVDGRELLPQFDLHFQGRLSALFKVLGFALEANYGDFLGGVVGAVRSMRTPSASAESTTSPGPHGGSSSQG